MKPNKLYLKESCVVKRRHETLLESGSHKEWNYKKACLIKSAVKSLLSWEKTKAEVRDEIKKAFDESDAFASKEMARIQADDGIRQVIRYTDSEIRTPFYPEEQNIDIFGVRVEVKPDEAFLSDLPDGTKHLEFVALKTSAPRITQNGRTKNSAGNCMELYAYLAAAREYAKKNYPEVSIVTGEFYYLRKKNDKPGDGKFDPDFFNTKGGLNIVTLSAPVSGDKKMDSHFKALFHEYDKGTQCSGKDCDGCALNGLCNFNLPPLAVEKEEKIPDPKFMGLSPEQERIIHSGSGIFRVNAGAGAGKTLTVALRVANLLFSGVKPEEICLLTFTDAGASEMKKRVQAYSDCYGCGADVSGMISTTFNSLGQSVLEDVYASYGYTAAPSVIDEVDRATIIRKIMAESAPVKGMNYRDFDSDLKAVHGAMWEMADAFAVIKANQLERSNEDDVDYLWRSIRSSGIMENEMTVVFDLYEKYEEELRSKNLIDYADQMNIMMKVISDNPFYFEEKKIRHIIVDEFQDSDTMQMELIKVLTDSPYFESLMVVGDDAQSIFGFRGTSPENIIRFFDLLGVKGNDLYLLENYRSTVEIVEMANAINAMNRNRIEKELKAAGGHGPKPEVLGYRKEEEELDAIAERIKKALADGRDPEDIAFIAYRRSQLLKMAGKLTEMGIPSVLLNPEPVHENSRVQGCIALARLFEQESDGQSAIGYLNVLFEGELLIHDDEEISQMVEELKNQVRQAKEEDAKKTFFDLAEAIGGGDEVYDRFLDRLKRKHGMGEIIRYAEDFLKFGKKIGVKREKSYPGVVLTTAHSSKGLEWDECFVTLDNFQEWRMGAREVEETRRLMYVAVTRAKQKLTVTGTWTSGGSKKDGYLYNHFLEDACNAAGIPYCPPVTENEK